MAIIKGDFLKKQMINIKKENKFNILNKKIFLIFIIIFLSTNVENVTFSKDDKLEDINYDILESQKESLDMKNFVKEANKYTKDVFSNTDMGELLNLAITGKVDNKKIFFSVWNILGKEFISCVSVISTIIVIIVIHSIIKAIGDGLENKSISRCYILCSIHINCKYYNKEFYRSNRHRKGICRQFG